MGRWTLAMPPAWFRYGYYLRFALAGWLFIAVFPFVAAFGQPDLLAGLLVVSRAEALLLGFIVGLALESLAAIAGFVASHAPRQFDLVFVDGGQYRHCELLEHASWLSHRPVAIALQIMPAAVLFAFVSAATWFDTSSSWPWFEAATTTLICLGGFIAADRLIRPAIAGIGAIEEAHTRLWTRNARRDVASQQSELSRATRNAFLVLAFWTALYVALAFVGEDSSVVAPLTSLIVVATWASWLLGTAAFLFDKWLVPLAVAIGAILVAAPASTRSDHIFLVTPQGQIVPRTRPDEIVRDDGGPIILVAASGGGIQAAGWTARVLQHLTESVPGFRDRLRLISSVSGGSVAVMFYLDDLLTGRREAVTRSDRSGLNGVAFGTAYRDLWRPVWSLFVRNPRWDRGFFLEQSWGRYCGTCAWNLSEFRTRLRDHQLPDFVFNATAVNAGHPVYLGTIQAPAPSPWLTADVHLSGWDLPIKTAARLSATFPFVSPAARPVTDSNEAPVIGRRAFADYIVDGGYYDNYGVATIGDILETGLVERQRKQLSLPRSVVVISIQASLSRDGRSEDVSTVSQVAAPLSVLLHVRETAQRAQARNEIVRIGNRWQGAGVAVTYIPVIFPLEEVPLSWRLTKRQLAALKNEEQGVTLCRAEVAVQRAMQGAPLRSRVEPQDDQCTSSRTSTARHE